MQRLRIFSALFVGLLWLDSGPGLSQASRERIPLILSGLQALDAPAYAAIRRSAPDARVQQLTLTRAEAWLVRPENANAVERTATRHGATVSRLGADWNYVFSPEGQGRALNGTPAARMTASQAAMMDTIRSSPATRRIVMMGMPRPAQVEYALSNDADPSLVARGAPAIRLKLSDDTLVTLVRTDVTVRSDKLIWRGRVADTGQPAVLMWWPGVRMAGTIHHNGRTYSIRCIHGEMHAIVELNEDGMPPEHAPMPDRMRVNDPRLRDDPLVQQGDASALEPRISRRAPAIVPEAAPNPRQPGEDVVITVIVAYTKKAASNYTDIQHELIELAIEDANQSFRNSGIPHVRLELVHAYQTDYQEEGTHFDHLWRFADKGDGYMDEIHGLRDQYDADVAVLVVDDAAGCGLATRVYADADEAFAVVNHQCADASYSLAHEIGHLIGARHEFRIDKVMTPFPYGHGYVNGVKWRDIMSYKQSCGGCPRLPIWSNPELTVDGDLAGTPRENNARVIAEQAQRVANFRASRRGSRAYSSTPHAREPGTGTADPR